MTKHIRANQWGEIGNLSVWKRWKHA